MENLKNVWGILNITPRLDRLCNAKGQTINHTHATIFIHLVRPCVQLASFPSVSQIFAIELSQQLLLRVRIFRVNPSVEALVRFPVSPEHCRKAKFTNMYSEPVYMFFLREWPTCSTHFAMCQGSAQCWSESSNAWGALIFPTWMRSWWGTISH